MAVETPPPDANGSGPSFRWFPGYSVAGVATVTYIATAPGQTFVLSQLNGPLREAFGIGALSLNTAYAVATVVAALPLVLVGRWTDRFGPRRTLAATAFAFGTACLVMASVTGFAGVVVAFFLLRFLGQGALSMVGQHATAMWFHRRLGSIHGIKQVVVFTSWVAVPQMALWLILTVGWRWTYVLFAGMVWLSVIPLALLVVRDRPEQVGLRMDNDLPAPVGMTGPSGEWTPEPAERSFSLEQALRTRAYWVLAAATVLTPLIGTAFLFDMQPMLATRGMDAQAAALAVSAWTAGMALAALPAGHLTDRIQPSRLIPAGLVALTASCLMLGWARAPWIAASAAALFAAGQSLVATSATTTVARWFGRTHHGAIRSSLVRLGVLGTGVGPLITGASAELTGGYAASSLAFVGICLPVLVLTLGLRAPDEPARASTV